MLSGELITKLTGRYLEFELFTLSFEEYEQMKQFYGKSIDSNGNAELNNYILEATDYTLQKRNGIKHINLMEFMKSESKF